MKKTITIDNGAVLTYHEFGEEHSETLVLGQFYFISMQPFLKELAKNFHVYGVEMRCDGPVTDYADDGEVDWPIQWGKDIYLFTQKLGIQNFHYVGKCHGSVPGWYLLQEHPEVLKSYTVMSLAPDSRTPKPNPRADAWRSTRDNNGEDGLRASTVMTVRKSESIEIKVAEMKSVDLKKYVGQKHRYGCEHFKTDNDLFDFFKSINTPMLMTFGMDDHLLNEEMVLKMAELIPGIKVVLLQGERHFYEIDIPVKLAKEITFFIQNIGLDC